ncbi:pyridoxal 5'-phosphate synthase [Streptomyces sp. NPDC058045]|uniref:pyridoxine/pyridoxamine 5'-phosphate oxidase n=1 Tax=Streptomyces sp. NPDC058045 TaxID=3346311 RepID=UPI0036E0B3A3
MPSKLQELLASARVWDPAETELPPFPALDAEAAPDDPVALFTEWFAAVLAAGQREPHVVCLATADADGPDARMLTLHGADERGWLVASHSGSRKGRQLAALPRAALCFHWPVLGRQVRVRGSVRTLPRREAQADLHARSTGALAAALAGPQSEPLDSAATLAEASRTAWERARREPSAEVPSWTVYAVRPWEVEFFQGERDRRHLRLRYHRPPTGHPAGPWSRELLWP